ncbi:hypothetical protein AYO40_00675 [Planctomycetaceae bacterium SCGC AG-212-D15]|nr:hypothetical protein AYO40_00675 [Planctomycetaceae bacterium SCGC AG-212-D15]
MTKDDIGRILLQYGHHRDEECASVLEELQEVAGCLAELVKEHGLDMTIGQLAETQAKNRAKSKGAADPHILKFPLKG